LIGADTLAAHLDDDDWTIFDCRFSLPQPERGPQAYREGHVPGAVYANLDKDLSSPKTAHTGRHPLPDPEVFMDWLGENGVDRSCQVVAYDDAGGAVAARLWWLLRWVGHDAAAVLDGGWKAWLDGGYPVTQEMPNRTPRRFEGKPGMAEWLSSDQLVASLDEIRLLDARGAPRFRGEKEPIDPVAGHVPGALNLPFDGNLDDKERFLTPAQLKQRFDAALAGADPGSVAHMCGSGVTACHNLLAMEYAGLQGSRLYVGSWSEWITDPQRPVATGGS